MVFCPIVCKVQRTRVPEKSELFLVDRAVSQPVESHVHGFGSLRLNSGIDDRLGGRIICLHGRGGLWMPHFFEDVSFFDRLACVDISRAEFCLRGGGHDGLDYFSDVEDSFIIRGKFDVF